MAVSKVESIATELDIEANDHEELIKWAMTALGSKVVSKFKRQL